MLYLVATPIGHLSDITFRAIETLKFCDYILCEDTRHSLRLLQHYDIHKPLKSYHKFNETEKSQSILDDLHAGKNICLISDAGTPGISDPGTQLVQLCISNQIPVTAIPGPCAAIQALSCSGLPTDHFQFIGFLPRKEGELKKFLLSLFTYTGTTICYESPHRLIDTLNLFHSLQPHRQLVVARELTKKFEEFVRGTAEEIFEKWKDKEPRGEIVLMIEPFSQTQVDWNQWSPEEHVSWMQATYSLSRKEAIKMVADLRQVSKRDIYNLFHN
ncbi:16S rRNA (cytidine(1402)-2'-O)-methyltransferase [Candidatus Protochlamydia amoebophila]|uniref:Ribosomal RNA small subunit methyltransferase I n=1 Tax=Candidatus Protochlamydia amoebophila TaxID=362787 RepID=A0A0C1H0L1_9BACT|nr:16S rRNA (cytidine(1402)-2'-O)-methyltransferase [Candidatus Protochlamydia amoebophila]KIC71289.1 Ribosomal RNA small subunit methyltransferase I [Candidatus Protochlamydia amoebophila]